MSFQFNAFYRSFTSSLSASFSPAQLFSNGEQGVWYDPSDLSTLFQDTAGTTPVTADGDPVGLMLDKSQGLELGEEEVVNGGFDTDTDWTKGVGWSISGGEIKALGASNGSSTVQDAGMIVGKTYLITYEITEYTSGLLVIRCGNTFGETRSSTGVFTERLLCTASSNIQIRSNTGGTSISVGNISVKELKGNHATQSVSASRPTYRTDGTLHWLEFDGVDDWMRTGIVALSASSEFLVAGGVKDNTTGLMVYFESGTMFVGGGFGLFLNDGDKETAAVSNSTNSSSVVLYQNTAQVNKVQILYGDLSTSTKGRLNGVQASDKATSGGVFEDRDIYIGARGGARNYLNGKIYGLVRATTGNETDMLSIESYLANKSGVTL